MEEGKEDNITTQLNGGSIASGTQQVTTTDPDLGMSDNQIPDNNTASDYIDNPGAEADDNDDGIEQGDNEDVVEVSFDKVIVEVMSNKIVSTSEVVEFMTYRWFDTDTQAIYYCQNFPVIKEHEGLHVWTDGSSVPMDKSYINGPKMAGIGVWFGDNDPRNISEPLRSGSQKSSRAEIVAFSRAVEAAINGGHDMVTVHTDCRYVINCFGWATKWKENRWRKNDGTPVKNSEELKNLIQLMQQINVCWQWIPRTMNKDADKLANKAARKARDEKLMRLANPKTVRKNPAAVILPGSGTVINVNNGREPGIMSGTEVMAAMGRRRHASADSMLSNDSGRQSQSGSLPPTPKGTRNKNAGGDNHLQLSVGQLIVEEEEGLNIWTSGASVPLNEEEPHGDQMAGIGVWFGDNDTRNMSQEVGQGSLLKPRAEIVAMIRGVEAAIRAGHQSVTVYIDNQYLYDCFRWSTGWINNKWMKRNGMPVKNKMDLMHLQDLRDKINIHPQLIPSSENGNAQKLAQEAAKRARDRFFANPKRGEKERMAPEEVRRLYYLTQDNDSGDAPDPNNGLVPGIVNEVCDNERESRASGASQGSDDSGRESRSASITSTPGTPRRGGNQLEVVGGDTLGAVGGDILAAVGGADIEPELEV